MHLVQSLITWWRDKMPGPFVTPFDPRDGYINQPEKAGGRGTGPHTAAPRAPFKWECKACGVENVTRFEDGCPSCGTGTPQQAAALARQAQMAETTNADGRDADSIVAAVRSLSPADGRLVTDALEFYLAQGGLVDGSTGVLDHLRGVVDALTQPDTVESYTLEEVAETLALGTRALKTLAERGSGPPCELRDGVPTYPKAAFDDWLAKKYA